MEDFDHQGKRRDQVESNFKAIGYSVVGLIALIIIYSIASLF